MIVLIFIVYMTITCKYIEIEIFNDILKRSTLFWQDGSAGKKKIKSLDTQA